jgi:hypothetical protein
MRPQEGIVRTMRRVASWCAPLVLSALTLSLRSHVLLLTDGQDVSRILGQAVSSLVRRLIVAGLLAYAVCMVDAFEESVIRYLFDGPLDAALLLILFYQPHAETVVSLTLVCFQEGENITALRRYANALEQNVFALTRAYVVSQNNDKDLERNDDPCLAESVQNDCVLFR